MTISHRPLTLVAIAILALAPAGCEDDAAVARDAVQQDLVNAATALRSINVAAANIDETGFDQIRTDLNNVVLELKSIRGGEPGHQAARLLMLATANRDLAALDLEQAGEIESIKWRDLAVAHAKLDAATRLQTRAMAVADLSVNEERDLLRRERRGAERDLSDAAEKIADVESPLQDLSRQNTADQGEIEQLDMQSNQLRREAARHGSADGFAQFEEAVQVERRADQIRYEVAQREIDLDYELKPLHMLWTNRRAQTEALLASIDAAAQDLDSLVQSYQSNADASRATAQRLRNEVVAVFDAAERNRTEMLDPLYEEVTTHLEEAAGHADQAASKMGRDANSTACLVAARAHGDRGRALAAQADGIASMESLAARLASATDLVENAAAYRSTRQDLAAKHQQLTEQARAAFQSAREQLDRVTSRDARAAVDAYKSGLDAAIAALGTDVSQPTTTLSIAPPSGGASPAPSSGGSAFGSADELIAFINGIDNGDLARQMRLIDTIHVDDDAGRDLVTMLRATAEPGHQFAQAMATQFGEAAMQRAASGGGGMNLGALGEAAIQSRAPGRVTIAMTTPGKPPATMDLVPVDGSWMIDGDTMLPGFTSLPPAQRKMMLSAAMSSVQVLEGLATRISAGEFASPEDALKAMMQEMMKAAGAAGASGSMPPPGK